MPDISYSVTMKVDKDNLSNQVTVSQVSASMAQAGLQSQTLTLSSTPTNISTATLTGVGMAFVRNLSSAATATITIGINNLGSFVGFSTLRGGEPAIFRMASGVDYQAIGASGARVRVDVTEG